MQISLNGKEQHINDGATVAALLTELNLKGSLAVEINQQICPKRRHHEAIINDGDVLEIVTIVGGG